MNKVILLRLAYFYLIGYLLIQTSDVARAQIPPSRLPPPQDVNPQLPTPAPAIPSPSPSLPPPADLLKPPIPSTTPEKIPSEAPLKISVKRFVVEGSTAFNKEKLDEVLAPFTNKTLSFTELLQARSAITELYIKSGYITSAAVLPPQNFTSGVVTIKVIEGKLEAINITGLKRLDQDYVRSRLAIATHAPLNTKRLLEALQLLRINPLIKNLSAGLSSGTRPGLNVLDVTVVEANTFNIQVGLDNGRQPSVGSFRRQVRLTQANLLGIGDGLTVGYNNTDGSNGGDINYTIPVNAHNGTVRLGYNIISSKIIEPPFNRIDIESDSRNYEISFRQPINQTPTQEFTLGLTASRYENDTTLLGIPYPLSPGASSKGRTRISAVRFFQEWTKRDNQQVFAARSQFNLGLNLLNSTTNRSAPDSRFFSWQVQAQWARLLAPDTLFLIRGDAQVANQALVPIEQFALGGLGSVRGYRQDLLLADNGVLLTTELRLPIFRNPSSGTVFHVIPFADFGAVSYNGGRAFIRQDTLASLGLGLQLTQGDRLNARLDWGIPLIGVANNKRTVQENGLYFSITANAF
ncbi:ShlB/FhaC/HecB family hemolysin secretion/activation protein [Aetokthonos hydrillicola Thurmond2011]|jgi:hemolysin activation/secretion protein|uniref:ShlB/FhaC/HecB family hemolysin secretion/activation protein n=1 Tax=Aetokthonos hydrillicola Thurmond2011 TaxID=2712845 RepID=A0AAP5I357_9CYAN|nr:ShlB/FhaC/HecB family hemolysin secretion/activation protein [Aetokthonos hydrillicola]MBO3458547.1 ShlB/FhaC/HecB family hemolysin secretion/activation protein [Aetokthonos hydrillicola CCALA 1050]MBW4584990.1 ShlB/FhaC/HecB family hemolysin secretion/activation protein [Aetokthonos hydrillicola CCALA 1050]MDR9894248.1 ShlB/FhaC/HecB family hemolysin secretion/activation protein [Aetokthonos hydrillicola Thurmond2011]